MKHPFPKESILRASGIALFGFVVFLALTAAAILFYGSYDFYGQALSELGIGETGFLFNFALIICALLAIPFFYTQLKARPFLSQTASIVAIASMLFLAGIGLFPMSFYEEHVFAASMFFISAAFAIMLYSMHEISIAALAKRREGQLFWKGVVFGILGFFVAEFTIFFMFVSRTPMNQKMAIALIIAWIIARILLEVEREVIAKKKLK